MTVNDEDRFAEFVISTAERIGKDCAYMYGWDAEEVTGAVLVLAYERRPFLDVTAANQVQMAEQVLRRAINEQFRKERARGIRESDQYFYEPEYVRLFLPFWFAKQDWDKADGPEDCANEWRTGDALDTAIDISLAWGRLRDWQQNLIAARHVECRPTHDGGCDWEAIAEKVGRAGGASARTGYADATRQLTVEMNIGRAERVSQHEGPGARTAMSNAKANAVIANA